MIIKPGRKTVSPTESVVTINDIPVGEEVPTIDTHIIVKWLQQNLSELLRAIQQAEENE